MFDQKEIDVFDIDEEDFDTVIADDISFQGTIKFQKPLMIKGAVTGSIDATSELVIDSNAVVNADIKASKVLVRGKVDGNIVADLIVHVTASGSVNGDITAGKVVLENGCFFSGKCTMERKSV